MSSLIRPFAALRPRPDTAQAVIAPPYDVVDTDEARALAEGHPHSFLHISRPEIDLPAGTDPHDDAVYAAGASKLRQLVEARILERESSPCFYAYRLATSEHAQTGIAFTASIAAYEAQRIHAHELTRPDKENDRVRNIEALNAQTGPVMLAYKSEPAVDRLLSAAQTARPLLEATGQHGVLHSIWRIDDTDTIDALMRSFESIGDLYIADGHHRSAAAARVAAARRSAESPDDAGYEYFLSVAFPDTEMRIYDYNRVVRDLNGLDGNALIAAIGRDFEIQAVDGQAKPDVAHSFGMYLEGRWYRLSPKESTNDPDPVARLDVSQLQQRILGPILGIGDPRLDERIAFVGGVRGLDDLERRVDQGLAAVAFALYPTSIHELMAVADAKRLMPPKSTWFEPKLADGLLTHVLDGA